MFAVLPVLVKKLFFQTGDALVIPPGGASISGALGHVAAVLEVAESMQDVEHIVLPQGSG